jgi:hypothetical protein
MELISRAGCSRRVDSVVFVVEEKSTGSKGGSYRVCRGGKGRYFEGECDIVVKVYTR